MKRSDLYPYLGTPLSRFLVGFEPFFDNLKYFADSDPSYPPYNIEKIDDNHYLLEMAVAGFSKKELNITWNKEENELHIKGKKDESKERKFIHRGLASRSFNQTLTLNKDIIPKDVNFDDGILTVKFERFIPEERKPVQLLIN